MAEEVVYSDRELWLNILANSAEVLATIGGAALLLTWWIPYINGIPGYQKKLLLTGLGMVLGGHLVPGTLNLIVRIPEVGWVLAFIAAALMLLTALAFALASYFLPTYFAYRVKKKKKRKSILTLNIFGVLPFCWLIAFIWSCRPDRPNDKAA